MKIMIKTANFWLAIILFINLSLFAYLGNEKYFLFLDEGFSYNDANGAYKKLPDISEDEVCIYNPTIFHKQLTVQKEEIFNYRSIVENLEEHPPLYFFIFHFINSLFPNVFSKWTGLIFNFIIFIFSQLALYALSREFLSAKKSFLPVIFYGFSVASICTALYVRNYMMMTMFVTLLCLYAVRLLKALDADDMRSYKRNLIYFCLVLFGGCLTHFYFFITAFIVCAGADVILLWQKKYKELSTFSISALGTASLCVLMLSYISLHNLLASNCSSEVAQTLYDNIFNHQFDVSVWSNFIRRDIFGNIFSASCYWFLSAIVLAFIYLLYRLKKRQNINTSIVLLAVTLILSVVFVSIVLPADIRFHFAAKRYFFHLVPLFVLLFILFMDRVFLKFKYSLILQMVVILLLLCRVWYKADFSVYLLTDKSRDGLYAQQLKDRTLWIRWQKDDLKWKKIDSALFSFYAKDFVIFRDFEDECYKNMINDENARQHSALIIENKGRTNDDCEKIVGYQVVFSRWSFCAYLPQIEAGTGENPLR